MSTSTLYTLGYARWTIGEVEATLRELDATLVDVRYAPYSSKPGFAKPALDNRFGARYVHVPGFGNANYAEGSIELANPEEGLRTVAALSSPLILMCGCQSPTECHRSDVATYLADHFDANIIHLRTPDESESATLFDDNPPSS